MNKRVAIPSKPTGSTVWELKSLSGGHLEANHEESVTWLPINGYHQRIVFSLPVAIFHNRPKEFEEVISARNGNAMTLRLKAGSGDYCYGMQITERGTTNTETVYGPLESYDCLGDTGDIEYITQLQGEEELTRRRPRVRVSDNPIGGTQ